MVLMGSIPGPLIRCHLVPKDHLAAKNPLGQYGPRSLGNRGKARCDGNQ